MPKSAWDSAVNKGYLKGRLESLLEIGRRRFGEPGLSIEARLAAITNLRRVQRMFAVVLRVGSWKALLQVK